jgi:hypothetical protein
LALLALELTQSEVAVQVRYVSILVLSDFIH